MIRMKALLFNLARFPGLKRVLALRSSAGKSREFRGLLLPGREVFTDTWRNSPYHHRLRISPDKRAWHSRSVDVSPHLSGAFRQNPDADTWGGLWRDSDAVFPAAAPKRRVNWPHRSSACART